MNETFGRRLSRFPLHPDGELGPKEVVTTFGNGTFPDGLRFDAEGHVWITSIVSNRVIRVAPDGAQTLVLEEVDAPHIEWAEQAYLAGTMGRPHLDKAAGKVLRNISSLAFGGPDLRTAYLGCLLGDRIASFRAPVAGAAPVHWHYGPFEPARARRPPAHRRGPSSRRPSRAPRGSLVEAAYRTCASAFSTTNGRPGFHALEQELALDLGMSRTPVREALIRLQKEGLVKVVPRHGITVLPVSVDGMRDIYDMLTALEPMAAELAAAATPARPN